MIKNLLWQFAQFRKPFPEVNSWAYRWELWKFDKRFPPGKIVKVKIVKEKEHASVYFSPLNGKWFASIEEFNRNAANLADAFRKLGTITWWHDPDSQIDTESDRLDRDGDIESTDERDNRPEL